MTVSTEAGILFRFSFSCRARGDHGGTFQKGPRFTDPSTDPSTAPVDRLSEVSGQRSWGESVAAYPPRLHRSRS
jgi:hypothetical protein